MRKSIVKRCFSFFIVFLLVFSMGISAYAETTYHKEKSGKVKAEKEISVNRGDNPSADFEEKIKKDGKTYKLINVSYKVIEKRKPVVYTKTITLSDKSKLKRKITKTIDGKSYELTVIKEPKWKDKSISERTETREYASKDKVPQNLSIAGKKLNLVSVKETTKKDTYSAPITFYSSNKNTNLYYFNGKVVSLQNGQPRWAGSETDIKNRLGINNRQYSIDSVNWQGGYTKTANGYVRRATVSGTKVIPIAVATFQGEMKTSHTAKVTYTDSQFPDGETKTLATATYEKEGLTVQDYIKIGAGVLILALGIAFLIWWLRKKNKVQEE